MIFAYYPNFWALHQAGIKIEDEETQQPRNTQPNTQNQNTFTWVAKVNQVQIETFSSPFANVINKPPRKYSNINLPLSKDFRKSSKDFNKRTSYRHES